MNFQIHNHVDTGRAYDLIVTLIKFKLELRDRVWPCSAIACFKLIIDSLSYIDVVGGRAFTLVF